MILLRARESASGGVRNRMSTQYCGLVSQTDVGRIVSLCGWVARRIKIRFCLNPSGSPDHNIECSFDSERRTTQPHGRAVRSCTGSERFNGVAGATTHIETIYFNAASTVISSSITSTRGSIKKKPEVGFGVVGTYTLT